MRCTKGKKNRRKIILLGSKLLPPKLAISLDVSVSGSRWMHSTAQLLFPFRVGSPKPLSFPSFHQLQSPQKVRFPPILYQKMIECSIVQIKSNYLEVGLLTRSIHESVSGMLSISEYSRDKFFHLNNNLPSVATGYWEASKHYHFYYINYCCQTLLYNFIDLLPNINSNSIR